MAARRLAIVAVGAACLRAAAQTAPIYTPPAQPEPDPVCRFKDDAYLDLSSYFWRRRQEDEEVTDQRITCRESQNRRTTSAGRASSARTSGATRRPARSGCGRRTSRSARSSRCATRGAASGSTGPTASCWRRPAISRATRARATASATSRRSGGKGTTCTGIERGVRHRLVAQPQRVRRVRDLRFRRDRGHRQCKRESGCHAVPQGRREARRARHRFCFWAAAIKVSR